MSETPHISREFKEKMLEWQQIKVTLKDARKDISALNSREKELKTYLSAYMNANKIDKCNCKDGSTVNTSKKVTKGTLTEKVIKAGLLEYLSSQEKADKCWETINENRTPKESVSLTYKQAKEQK
jgi:hypothetical protein